MNITYYAIFQYDPDGICIEFPDIHGAYTCAQNNDGGIYMARDVLGLVLHGISSSTLPQATAKEDILLVENQKLFSISITLEEKDGKLFNPNVIELEGTY